MTTSYAILSLDLGTHCGWCEVRDCIATRSGIVHLPGPEFHAGLRFLTFSNWLHQFKDINEIFYEDVPRFESLKSAKVYCGLLAIVQMFCLHRGIPYTNIKSNTVKMEFAGPGQGNCKKAVMCGVAHKLGWQGGHPSTDIDHDEADAIACAWVILNRRDVKLSLEELQHGFTIDQPKRKSYARPQNEKIQDSLLSRP